MYYESEITDFNFTNRSTQTEDEQTQASITGMSDIWNLLTWGWIKQYAEPLYSNSSGVKSFIDNIIKFLNSLTGFVVIIALIEFVRNRPNILGG